MSRSADPNDPTQSSERRSRFRIAHDQMPGGWVEQWPPACSLAADADESGAETGRTIYCGTCNGGPFDGLRGLRAHHGQSHPDEQIEAVDETDCCHGLTDTSPHGRRYCTHCGLILSEVEP